MDCIKFKWHSKGRTLTIAGKGLPNGEPVVFEDDGNERWYKWTFEKTGTYTVTNAATTDPSEASFTMKVHVTTARYQLNRTIATKLLLVGALLIGLMFLAYTVHWFMKGSFLTGSLSGTAVEELWYCDKGRPMVKDRGTGMWQMLDMDLGRCCR